MIGECFFFFKQKTAYEMRISDWSSDVCSSDLRAIATPAISSTSAGSRSGATFRNTGGPPAPRDVMTPSRSSSSEIGRASCRERVCQSVKISVVAVSLKKTTQKQCTNMHRYTYHIKKTDTCYCNPHNHH